MAAAVDFRIYHPENSRADLVRRIEDAPLEHAQAVLAAYDLLERLHEKGILDLMNGFLSAGDTVVNQIVNVISSREAVTALRIALLFSNLLSAIDADKLHDIITSAADRRPSLLAITKQATSVDAQRGLAVAVELLNMFGAALNGPRAKDA